MHTSQVQQYIITPINFWREKIEFKKFEFLEMIGVPSYLLMIDFFKLLKSTQKVWIPWNHAFD